MAQEDQEPDQIEGFTPLQIPAGQVASPTPNLAGSPNLPRGLIRQGPQNLDPAYNKAIDFIRPFVAQGGSDLAGLGLGTVTANPIMGFAARTGTYGAIDTLMQYLKTQSPDSIQEAIGEGEKNALVNAVGLKIMNGIFRGIKGIYNAGTPEIYKFAPTTSQALESYGFHNLATAAKHAEDLWATGAKSRALDRAGGEGFTQALRFANALDGRLASTNVDPTKLLDNIKSTLSQGLTSTSGAGQFKSNLYHASDEAMSILTSGKRPFEALDNAIEDPDQLSKILTAGQLQGQAGLSVRKDLAAYQFMKMVQDATTKDASGAVRINPNKIAEVFNDPKLSTSMDLLYGKQGRNNITDFMKNLSFTQDEMAKSGTLPRYLRYTGAGGFLLGTGMLSHYLGLTGLEAAGVSAASIGGLKVSASTMGRLLTNPTTAKILTEMAAGNSLGNGEKLAAKVLLNTLQGSASALVHNDGKETWGTVDKDPQTGGYSFVPYK